MCEVFCYSLAQVAKPAGAVQGHTADRGPHVRQEGEEFFPLPLGAAWVNICVPKLLRIVSVAWRDRLPESVT